MWAVAQKCCWAPAKGPHKGSQIISLQCKCDDSGSRGSLVVQPPPPLPCSASPVLVLSSTRRAGCKGILLGTVPSELKAHAHLTLEWEQEYPRTLTDPSLQVSLESGKWPEWAGPFPHEAPTQLSTKPLLCVPMRGLAGAGGGAPAGQCGTLSGKGPRRSCHLQREQRQPPKLGSQTVTLCTRYSTPGAEGDCKEGGVGTRREVSN